MVEASVPEGSTVAPTPIAGPRLVPKIDMISPGARGPGCRLAPFRILRTAGVATLAADSVKVTLRLCGVNEAPVGVTRMVPVYCPAASPLVVTETTKDAGVVPEAGVTVSQFPVLVPAAVNETGVPELATATVCDAGAAAPATAAKESVAG